MDSVLCLLLLGVELRVYNPSLLPADCVQWRVLGLEVGGAEVTGSYIERAYRFKSRVHKD